MGLKRRMDDRGRDVKVSTVTMKDGLAVAVEPKPSWDFSAAKEKELYRILRSVFVDNVPHEASFNLKRDLYGEFQAVKARIPALALKGGPEYDRLVFDAKYAWTDKDILQSIRKAFK